MNNSVSPIAIAVVGLAAVVALAALALYARDRLVGSHPESAERARARVAALMQFRTALQLCIPGVLIMVFGAFYVIDRMREHESDWWSGLLFIPVGWMLVPLLARRSWRRYRELRKSAEKGEDDYISTGPPPIEPG
jgi:hypothetical protein